MQIIEQYIQGKFGDPSLCEDGIFHNEHFVAVIDGVTAKGNLLWKGHRSGYHAKELILWGLAQLTGTETVNETLGYLNSLLSREYGDRSGFFRENLVERLQAVMVIYSAYHRQVWCMSSCQYMVNEEAYIGPMKMDDLMAELRSVYLQFEILQGKTVAELCLKDPSQEVILPFIKKQFLFTNNFDYEYGFSLLDGFCTMFPKIMVTEISPGSTVVLASDGYPILKSTLQQSEAELETLKLLDPLCISRVKSTGGFTDGKEALDDRAYIRFKV